MTITLRAVQDSDASFLFSLYASTREFELSQVPWTEEQKQSFLEMQFTAQTRSYQQSHPAATHQIICADERPAGRLYLDRQANRLHILDITIAPKLRNARIGSQVLRAILEEADRGGKAVSIYVETFNPSLRLFERLGFIASPVDGVQVQMERAPRAIGN